MSLVKLIMQLPQRSRRYEKMKFSKPGCFYHRNLRFYITNLFRHFVALDRNYNKLVPSVKGEIGSILIDLSARVDTFWVTVILVKTDLWWCWPPAFPRPPGCFLEINQSCINRDKLMDRSMNISMKDQLIY